jgi:hypothetical protein
MFPTDEIADDKWRVKLTHAYATTIYGAQGCTTDRAFVWLSPELPLSERKHATEIDPISRRTDLAGQLARSGFKRSSLDILVAAQAREAEKRRHEAERTPERKQQNAPERFTPLSQ